MTDDGSSIEALYARMRTLAGTHDASSPAPVPEAVAPGIRRLALRTPTLPPAAHTNVYLVGPASGPVAVVDPGSPYPEQQAILDSALEPMGVHTILITHHHGDHVGGAAALAARWGAPIAAHPATAHRLAGRVTVSRLVDDGEAIAGTVARWTPGMRRVTSASRSMAPPRRSPATWWPASGRS